jgi:hypothetical protein
MRTAVMSVLKRKSDRGRLHRRCDYFTHSADCKIGKMRLPFRETVGTAVPHLHVTDEITCIGEAVHTLSIRSRHCSAVRRRSGGRSRP